MNDQDRQVHGDSLLERGDRVGELIQVQQALAALPEDSLDFARRLDLEVADLRLRRELEPFTVGYSRGHLRYRRGRVESIELAYVDDEDLEGLITLLSQRAAEATELRSSTEAARLLEELPRVVSLYLGGDPT